MATPISTLTPWLHALTDTLANLRTTTNCIRLGDLSGDGDYNLCICDIEKKLRVYKGSSQIVDYELLDTPNAMCIINMEVNSKIPSIAVASNSNVFIYRQLRPYKKWTCPPLPVSAFEVNIWKDLNDNSSTTDNAIHKLTELRDQGVKLTSRSIELISLETEESKYILINEYKTIPLSHTAIITCMETLKKENDEADALCMLVVGTESGHIYILPLDPTQSQYLCQVELPSAPVSMVIQGVYDIDWRVSVICRDGMLYHIKNGDKRNTAVLSGSINDIGSMPVCIARQDKNIWIACMDKSLSCFNLRGKKLHSILLSEDIVEICILDVKRSKISNLLLVILITGEVRLYKETALIDSFRVSPPVSAVRFGSYGRYVCICTVYIYIIFLYGDVII